VSISPVGLLVCAALYGLGWLFDAPLIVGLIASLAFGTTSAVTLSAVGGSSPLIYLVFAALLVGSVAASKEIGARLRGAFSRSWVATALCVVAFYAAGSAYVLPRLFSGLTNAFITAREKGVVEVALAPNSGNITQTGYFILGTMTALAILALASERTLLPALEKGFSCWAFIVALAGVLDLSAKMAGLGDIFDPIRTASFAFLTQDGQAGFYRINGLSSEASGFAAAALAAMAFSFTAWKFGGSRLSLLLGGTLLTLLVLSTSSTAYAGLTLMAGPVLLTSGVSFVRDRVGREDVLLVSLVVVVATVILLVVVASPARLEPLQKLIQVSIFDKAESESGRERAHWNQQSLASLSDTYGLGIGFGSSRASNWLVAVLSQMGIPGTALQLVLLVPMLWPIPRPDPARAAHKVWTLCQALRSCALTSLISGIVSGASADPGLLFFVALAGFLVCRDALRSDPGLAAASGLRRPRLQPEPRMQAPAASERSHGTPA
jgi:hypothetical protein